MFNIFPLNFPFKIAIRENFPKCNHLQLFSVTVITKVEFTSKNSNNFFFHQEENQVKKRNCTEEKG